MTYPPSSSPAHGGRDPSLPCSSCGKRHARSHDNNIVGASITNPFGKSPSKKSASAIVTVILALLSSSPSAAAKAAALPPVPSTGAVSSSQSETATASARSSRRGAGDGPDGTWDWKDLFASAALPGAVTKEGRSLAEDDGSAVLDDAHDHDDAHVTEGDETEGLDAHDHDHDHDALSLSQAEASASSSIGKGVSAKQWGQIIGVTLLVNLASLVGLLLLTFPVMRRHYSGKKKDSMEQHQQQSHQGGAGKKNKTKFERLVHICLPAFVVGALLATAAFLLFPEALHLISGTHHEEHGADDGGEEGHDEHHDHRFLQDEDHGGHDDHGDGESVAAAKFGVAFLGGFLLPFVFSLIFPHSHGHPHDRLHRLEHGHDDDDALSSGKEDDAKSLFASDEEDCASCKASARDDSDVPRDAHVGVSVTAIPIADRDEENINHQKTPSAAPRNTSAAAIVPTPLPPKTLLDKSLILSIITGDFLCNFADGIFVTAALLHCPGPTFLSILLVTILHELPQEFADFFLLVEYAGLTVLQASVVNFLSGLSVTLGGIVVAAGNPSDETVGVVIAMAGGAYASIAACETLPRMEKWVEGRRDRLAMMAAFVAGTIPFGLVLLKHEHCG